MPKSSRDDEEQEVFVSLHASLQEHDVYQDQVLRKARHRLAPTLIPDGGGTAFPPLDGLTANLMDPMHVHSILKRTRQKILKRPNDLDCMKEQILLCFLQRTTSEVPIRPDERRTEAKRSQALIGVNQQHQSAATELPGVSGYGSQMEEESTTRATKAPRSGLHPRVPIMKRKRWLHDDDDSDKDQGDVQQRKEALRQLRKQRMERKLERRQALLSEQQSTDDDLEAEFENDESNIQDAAKESSLSAAVTCPLCQHVILCENREDMDATLAQHMGTCQEQQQRGSIRGLRSRRNGVVVMPYQKQVDYSHKLNAYVRPRKRARLNSKKKTAKPREIRSIPARWRQSLDDLDEFDYEERVDDWIENGLDRMKEMKERDVDDVLPGEELYSHGLVVPAWVNDRLFGYQRQGLRWMWDLHVQEGGGILGDEMGLGKTVMISSFLGVLASCRKLKSALLIAPATLLQHWLNELSIWAPGLRRILVHPSGEVDGISRSISHQLLRSLGKWLQRVRRDRLNEAIDDDDYDELPPHSLCGTGYVVVTTYENFRRNPDIYTAHPWSYVVLDEAQKIKSPDADVTLSCKRLQTPHRIAISGTPIQNDLRELWSIFDFVFPGRLGTLPAFEQQFAEPIKRGGYANASPMQVQLAYRCALMLRDLICPYLLRRLKKDVKEVNRMPGKTEHVLFCRLSDRQRSLYEAYIRSDEVRNVMRGSSNLLGAVTVLRKICNHPDLICDPSANPIDVFSNNHLNMSSDFEESDEGYADTFNDESILERAGKLEVLSRILPIWKKQGHRVLIFCQWRKMLSIIQHFIMLKGWKFGRLDGNTNVAVRQRLVDTFNQDESYFGMLCTTRTGGVGLNLTGANRIVIYDPDFNPMTDAQARERAWRFGNQREVTIYRLVTAGTIEEKIYQRQIFKTALSNTVLQDPRQRRLFSQRDLRDLFSLQADTGSLGSGGFGTTETSDSTGNEGVLEPLESNVLGDDEDTLRSVMKSRGLAGIFDHSFVEDDSSRKSASAREMEEQAKKVARMAAEALRQSVALQSSGTPSWTNTQQTESRTFGNEKLSMQSSRSVLQSLRKHQSGEDAGMNGTNHGEADKYSQLLMRIKAFVRHNRPTTSEILDEFSGVSECDVAIFRRLLKSVASLDNGRWTVCSL